MRLLIRSVFRHLKEHLLQTVLTMAVTVLITGMLAVLFHLASSFQEPLRTRGLERHGTYHYKYYTNAGTSVAKLYAEMEKRFKEDDWFSDVELVEDGGQVNLILTVAHPGFFTTKTMEKKFDAVMEDCFEPEPGEVSVFGNNHNLELLASYGDLSKQNGIYTYLCVFLVLLATISVAAILTIGAMFRVSAMQREREIALLSGIGAGRGQIVGMILMESVLYCLVSIPAGFVLGILVYKGIQRYIDSIIYTLFQFPPADLVVSVPYSVALAGCAACVILLSGLRSAVRVSRISPMEVLSRTKDIRVREGKVIKKGKSPYENRVAARPESWLAKKSWRRFKRRNRPVQIMLAVTFVLCFVLNGVKRYSTEVVKMDFGSISYNFSVDLYSDEKAELNRLASMLADSPDNQLTMVREMLFNLQSPYPFSEIGEFSMSKKGGMMPDVCLQCIDEASFKQICEGLGISADADGLWGIFLDTERSWSSDGVKVKGRPYALAAGEQLRFYDMSKSAEGEEFILNIAGVYDKAPLHAEITESNRLQVLVPDAVFSVLEEKRPYMELDPGIYHISLRGKVVGGKALGKRIEEQAGSFPGVTCIISDFEEELQQVTSGIESFEFLCEALILIFTIICICGNFTISWAINKAREREFATFLSVGMQPGDLQKMRLLELLYNVRQAFLPGVLVGLGVYHVIYLVYTTEYMLSWHFPLTGLLLGMATLVISVGVTDLALRFGSGKKSLSEQLRMEE